jgi:hypothetical protein
VLDLFALEVFDGDNSDGPMRVEGRDQPRRRLIAERVGPIQEGSASTKQDQAG